MKSKIGVFLLLLLVAIQALSQSGKRREVDGPPTDLGNYKLAVIVSDLVVVPDTGKYREGALRYNVRLEKYNAEVKAIMTKYPFTFETIKKSDFPQVKNQYKYVLDYDNYSDSNLSRSSTGSMRSTSHYVHYVYIYDTSDPSVIYTSKKWDAQTLPKDAFRSFVANIVKLEAKKQK